MTWTSWRLKHLAAVPIRNGLGERGEFDDPDWPRYIRTTDIAGPTQLRSDTFKSLPPAVAAGAMLESGDLLMTAAGATIGKSFTFEETYPACYAGYLVRFRPAPDLVDGRFVAYWMQSGVYWAQVDARRVKSTIENFSASKYGELSLLLPPLSSQRAIADYLDTETARIDALIAKKGALASCLSARLFEEMRLLVVGGHRLDDPMSARQEELRAGWRALKLGRHLSFGSGTTPTSSDPRFYGPGVPWIVTGDLRDREVTQVKGSVTETALNEFSALKVHPAGSLVVAMYGATVGRLGITSMPAAVNQACSVLGARDGVDLQFLFFFILSHRSSLLERCVGAGQPNISQDILRSLRIPVPDIEEQMRIVSTIEKRRRRSSELVGRLERQVGLLRQHRQALITGAVTGELEIPGVAS